MSQTKQQEQGTAPAGPRARKDWEWFWRIVAGLMLLLIAWVAWVLYEITPRSVVTPLAYATRVRPIGAMQSASDARAPTVPAAAANAPRAAPGPDTAELAMDLAQAALRAGAHQASADIQAAAAEAKDEQVKGKGLRLATELSTPVSGKNAPAQEGTPGGAPAAAGAAGKARP